MSKPVIDAKEALGALRSGLSDSEIMERYNLSARGLESLLKKLVKAGIVALGELEARMPEFVRHVSLSTDVKQVHAHGVHTVSAKDAVADVKSGVSDSDLMMKYRLSARGLEHLFEQLLSAGLVDEHDIERRLIATDSTVDVRDLQRELEGAQAPPPKTHVPREPVRSSDRPQAKVGLKVPPDSRPSSAESDTTVELSERRKSRDRPDATLELQAVPPTPTPAPWRCPACDRPQPQPYEECPVCGVIVAKFLKKQGKS